jgi:hypothetical protein
MVTGYLDPAALAAMTDHWLAGGADTAARDPLAPAALAAATRDRTTAVPLGGEPFAVPRWTRKRLADTLLRYAADALSGPGGLASFLRTSLLPGTCPRSASPTRWPPSASPWTWARPPAPFRRGCAAPSSSATATASSPAATSPPPPVTCIT